MVRPNSFKGKQLVLASGRIILIARDNDIFINSKETISLSSNKTINLDSGEHVIVESPKIYLGVDSTNEKQPTLRGSDVTDLLTRLINSLNDLVSVCEKTPGDIPTSLMLGLGIVKGAIAGIKETYSPNLNKTLSKKTFVV